MKAFKIVQDVQPVSAFLQYARHKPCRQKCGVCSKKWAATGSTHVNLLQFVTNDLKPGKKWICTQCADKLNSLKNGKDHNRENGLEPTQSDQ
jgi:hypothetical protein